MSCSTATTAALFYRSLISSCLSNGEHVIVFQKKDKSNRTMKCTLDHDIIQGKDITHSESYTPQSLTNQPVYDLDANQWKSFNFTSLIEIDGKPVTEFLCDYLDNIFKTDEKEQ